MWKSFRALRCAVATVLPRRMRSRRAALLSITSHHHSVCHPLLHTSSAQLEWQRPRPFIMTSHGVIYSLSDSPLLVGTNWCSKSMRSTHNTSSLVASPYISLFHFRLPLSVSLSLFTFCIDNCLSWGIAWLVMFTR